MSDPADGKRDFFVSFNQADRAWATWIAWALEAAGYSVFFQDWDFKGNFVLEMDKAHTRSRRTVAVLSPDYLTSRFAAPEWAARFAQDATSEHDLLIPVRVRPCALERAARRSGWDWPDNQDDGQGWCRQRGEGVARPELRHWRRRTPEGTRRLAVAVDRAKERVSSRQ